LEIDNLSRFLFLLLHGLTAAVKSAVAAAGHDIFGPAFFTEISLSNLVRHFNTSSRKNQ
jgi:hypothetical protein